MTRADFTGLNAALARARAVIHVPAGVSVPRPIRIVLSRRRRIWRPSRHADRARAGEQGHGHRGVRLRGRARRGVDVGVSEITVGQAASSIIATLQRWGSNVLHFGLERRASSAGAALPLDLRRRSAESSSKPDMELHLDGRGVRGEVLGLLLRERVAALRLPQRSRITASAFAERSPVQGRAPRPRAQDLPGSHPRSTRMRSVPTPIRRIRNLILSDKARARFDPEPRDPGERRPLHARRDRGAGGRGSRSSTSWRAGSRSTRPERLIISGFLRAGAGADPVGIAPRAGDRGDRAEGGELT
jgi:hypothetical protein